RSPDMKIVGGVSKLFFIMRITACLLLLGCLHLSAASLSQTVSLQARSQSLKNVFGMIEAQTGYSVVYNNRLVNERQRVTVNVHNMPLDDFLDQVLSGQSLTYSVKEHTILIKSKESLQAVKSAGAKSP